jgi:peptidoglycan/LPS O-acetylase OafA/YrhL
MPALTSAITAPSADGGSPAYKASAFPEKRQYFPALDGLRACAAILVFLEHYYLYRHSAYLHWGWVGVDVFFVLSGFLITGILYDSRDSEHRIRNFYIRRTLRIFPLYYGAFLLALLLTPVFHWSWGRYWLLWLVYAGNYGHLLVAGIPLSSLGSLDELHSRFAGLYLSFGHFWSLCVEEQFYLAWPFVVFLLRDRKRLLYLCCSIVVIMPFVRLAATFLLPGRWIAADALYFGTEFRIDALFLGAILALILRGPKANSLFRFAWPLLFLSLFLFLVTWVTAATLLHQGFGAGPDVPWIRTFGFTFIDLMAAAILILTLQPATAIYSFFSIGPLRRFGTISYGFYVFHALFQSFYYRLAVILTFGHTTYIPAVTLIVAFVCTLFLARLSFRFFESPFLVLKDRWTR